MSVSRDRRGYVGYCHRCSETFNWFTGDASVSELKQATAAIRKYETEPSALPRDFTLDIPDEGRVWLLKAGVNHDIQDRYGIGWSAHLNRVILPIRRCDSTLVGTCARKLSGHGPKYLSNITAGEHPIFLSEPRVERTNLSLVIVEDVLSAIRVGELVSAAAILGTTADTGSLSYLVSMCRANHKQDKTLRIGVWCDPDNAGRAGSDALIRSLSLFGVQTRRIVTTRDPKYYSNAQIKDILK